MRAKRSGSSPERARSTRAEMAPLVELVGDVLLALFSGSGLLLVRVWPEERRHFPGPLPERDGAAVALFAAIVLGSIPLLIAVSPIEPWPKDNIEISPVSALVESARYGFNRDLPAFLQIESSPRFPGGPTHPPRSATVTMAASALAAGFWILFVLISFIGRSLPAGEARWKFLLLSPQICALAVAFRIVFMPSMLSTMPPG